MSSFDFIIPLREILKDQDGYVLKLSVVVFIFLDPIFKIIA